MGPNKSYLTLASMFRHPGQRLAVGRVGPGRGTAKKYNYLRAVRDGCRVNPEVRSGCLFETTASPAMADLLDRLTATSLLDALRPDRGAHLGHGCGARGRGIRSPVLHGGPMPTLDTATPIHEPCTDVSLPCFAGCERNARV